ncbi:hypothetical protein ACFC0C_36995 [Streptomyces sp. NPDC056178]|uniref:hypothetical protein n=1 Tax=unclassified Streptomyces TaxID=2593676 RepID=UPI0035DFEA97
MVDEPGPHGFPPMEVHSRRPLAMNDVKGVTTKGFAAFNRPGALERQAIHCCQVHTFTGEV